MKKILIIDDDEALRWLLDRILSKGYDTTMVNDGMAAFKWLSMGNEPDLIISDINMPSLSGGAFLKELRFSSLYRDIPVIVLSADENPRVRKECLEMGVAKFVTKPFQPTALIEEINEVLTLEPPNRKFFRIARS